MELHRKSFVWLHILSVAAQCSRATFIVNSIEYHVDSKEVWNCRLLSLSYRKQSFPIECNHIQNEETSVIMVFAFFLETIIHPFMAKVQVCILFAKEQLKRKIKYWLHFKKMYRDMSRDRLQWMIFSRILCVYEYIEKSVLEMTIFWNLRIFELKKYQHDWKVHRAFLWLSLHWIDPINPNLPDLLIFFVPDFLVPVVKE